MPQIEEHAKNILRLRKGEEPLFWMLHKVLEIVYFSATVIKNIHQCNITFSFVHVQVSFNYFLFVIMFLSRVAADLTERICASG